MQRHLGLWKSAGNLGPREGSEVARGRSQDAEVKGMKAKVCTKNYGEVSKETSG